MKLRKRNAFTLIELIATLVIMAIIALIVTLLVMSIIRKARISADKRSIDAYGRSIELAIAGYLMDTGTFPTSISQLTIEYSGDEVVCTTTQLNSDSSVYLADCTVGGRSVEGYTYGKEETITYDAYSVGDHVSYNGVTFYVIEDSDATNDTVKLLKEEPLTYAEMTALNLTGITITESNGYGTVQYGGSTDYSQSTVKQVVDAWKNTAVGTGDTAAARLITIDDLTNNLGYEFFSNGSVEFWQATESTPTWVYNSNYYYWTMSQYNDSTSDCWLILNSAYTSYSNISSNLHSIRPALELNKSADISIIN